MMTVNKCYKIDSLEGVEEFLSDLTNLYQCIYHPDDDESFAEFIDAENNPTFSKEDGLYLDSIMDECIEFCNANGLDIYAMGLKYIHWLDAEEVV